MNEKFQKLQQYNLWGEMQDLSLGYLREDYTQRIMRYVGNRLVKVLVGQRRAGKSVLMRQIVQNLIDSGIDRRNIFMLNLEMVAFDFVYTYKDLEELFQTYLQQINPQGRVYLFMDEIQNVEGWERFVNSYSQDITREYEIFITGSNSKMLSGELATLLSGRYVSFTVLPFSFEEFAGAQNKPVSKATYLEYMQSGGLPELLHLEDEEVRRHYVSALKDTILLRDIVQRNSIKDVALLEDLLIYLINNTSCPFSINSIMKYYKSLNKSVSFEKLSQYISYLVDTQVIHRVERSNIQGKEIIAGVTKYYANDLAFLHYLYRGMPHGLGYDLENLHYLDLLRAGYKVYVGNIRGKEVDFVATRGERVVYVQSCYLLSDEQTIRREYAALEAIGDHYEKYVVSLDDLQMPSRNGIRHVQAWNFSKIVK